MPAQHDIDSEREVWDAFAESAKDKTLEADPVFCWTQYSGHGPGPELLGSPRSALEIGCGTGRALAFLLNQGVKVTGLDLSPVAVKHLTERWGGRGAEFICGEVLERLAVSADAYDAIYSLFGAAWFTDPERLFPLVAARLNSGGVFAFSQPPAIPGAYGPQGMYKGGFAGKATYTYRYSYTPRKWAAMLSKNGFGDIEVKVVDAPAPGHIGTLIVRGVKH
ncbi:class I SAM-dependent methyltransferase [Streptomyces sp. NPDC048483]|uniref:class I SAM-dependent methyltransferase n=1 Tax=Streptomyces sp. NPDC048483 TaxID=3154927 RepID=UPI0034318504